MVKLVLEITRTSVRGVAAEGTLHPLRIRQVAIEPVVDVLDVGTLRRLLEVLRITKPECAVVAIPRADVIARQFRLPSTDPAELSKMVALLSQAQLPYPSDRAVVDFQVVAQEAGMSAISFIAAHRDRVDRNLSVLREAGCEPHLLVPSSWGLLAWYRRLGIVGGFREPVMVMNLDVESLDLVLIREGRLLWSRSISRETEESRIGNRRGTEWLMEEITRSVFSLKRERPAPEVNSVLLTGIGELEEWQAGLEERLATSVTIKRAEDGFEIPSEALPLRTSLTVALGLAVAEREWLVNLLPRDVGRAQRSRRRRRELLHIGSLLVVVLALGIAVLCAAVRHEARVVSCLNDMVSKEEARSGRLRQREHDVKILETALDSRRGTARMLRELFQLTPAEVSFENLACDRTHGECVVRGRAATMSRLLEYLRRLEQSNQWTAVALHHAARRNASADSDTDFEIALRNAS